MAGKKPSVWTRIKNANAAIENVIDAVIPGGNDDPPPASGKGRLVGPQSPYCHMPKRNGAQCGRRKASIAHAHCDKAECARIYARMLEDADNNYEAPQPSHQKGYPNNMRQQVWDEDKGKWVYPKPGRK